MCGFHIILSVNDDFLLKSHHHRHHHWFESPKRAVAFLRSFCQLKYPAIASSDFVTRVISWVRLSAPRPVPCYPEGPSFVASGSRFLSLHDLRHINVAQEP
jgi:hypothetical protein